MQYVVCEYQFPATPFWLGRVILFYFFYLIPFLSLSVCPFGDNPVHSIKLSQNKYETYHFTTYCAHKVFVVSTIQNIDFVLSIIQTIR